VIAPLRALTLALLALAVLVGEAAAQGSPHRLKVTGTWADGRLLATRIQDRGGKKDPGVGKVAGTIGALGPDHELRIGPVTVAWTDSTAFTGLAADALAPGVTLEVTGRIVGDARILATAIEPATLSADVLEILALAEEPHQLPDGSRAFRLLGLPVVTPRRVLAQSNDLTRNPDDRRPAEQLTVSFLGRPLTIGGEVGTNSDMQRGYDLEGDRRDRSLQLEQQLDLELTYPLSGSALIFLKAKGGYSSEREAVGDPLVFDWALERGESWIYLDDIGGTGLGLQVGRQNFHETREWWWDKDLDGARVRYDRPTVHAELAFARDVAPVSIVGGASDPEDAGIRRWFGQWGWLWRRGHRLEGFFLAQQDRSGHPAVGARILEQQEDDSDADLRWFGGRISGELDRPRLEYWIQGAGVRGRDTRIDFASAGGDSSLVAGQSGMTVRGWALDGGLSLATALPGRPTFTVSYATGSGDGSPDDGTDRAFRQTGIHDNNGKFGGVDRFRYYGELLRPELSNLQVVTAAAGVRLLRSSSIELLYHHYRQIHPAASLPGARLDADPEGRDRGIGDEWDLVIGLEEWRHFEVEAVGALFRAGPAFGDQQGTTVHSLALKIDYNF